MSVGWPSTPNHKSDAFLAYSMLTMIGAMLGLMTSNLLTGGFDSETWLQEYFMVLAFALGFWFLAVRLHLTKNKGDSQMPPKRATSE